MNRKEFLKLSGGAALGLALGSCASASAATGKGKQQGTTGQAGHSALRILRHHKALHPP